MGFDPALGRFIQPDSIIPDPGSAKGYDRYAYVNNNPVNYNDPSGHFAWLPILVAGGALIGAGISYGTQVYDNMQENGGNFGQALTQNIDLAAIGESALAGSAIGLAVGVAAPIAVGLVGQGIAGVGLITGSTSVFTAGVGISGAALTLDSFIYGTNPLANVKYSDYVQQNMDKGDYHSFPKEVDSFGSSGTTSLQIGGDGAIYTHVEIPGAYNNEEGVFHYIIDGNRVVTHRLFEVLEAK